MEIKIMIRSYSLPAVFCGAAIILTAFRHAAAGDTVLIIKRDLDQYNRAANGIIKEIGEELSVNQFSIDKDTKFTSIKSEIDKTNPRLIVLMDNLSISLFKQYQSRLPDSIPPIPSVSLMGINVKKAVKSLKNATGIEYEIPAVTSLTGLRRIIRKNINKAGVVHTELLSEFINDNKYFCLREKIELVNYRMEVKEKNAESFLKKHLKKLVEKDKVDAVWVPNESLLLNLTLISNVWQPFVRKYEIPVIVGVEVLVTPKFNIGTFAVLPDHTDLGGQAGQLIFEIMDNDWNAGDMPVVQPLSVEKVINAKQAKSYFNLDEDGLRQVDRIIK